MPKKKKFSSTEELFRAKLADWDITAPPRLGNFEYVVATNLFIIEELQKLNGMIRTRLPKPKKEEPSMLDY